MRACKVQIKPVTWDVVRGREREQKTIGRAQGGDNISEVVVHVKLVVGWRSRSAIVMFSPGKNGLARLVNGFNVKGGSRVDRSFALVGDALVSLHRLAGPAQCLLRWLKANRIRAFAYAAEERLGHVGLKVRAYQIIKRRPVIS
jgi:hypothetical protein